MQENQNIQVKGQTSFSFPNEFIESKLIATSNQFDILSILIAQVNMLQDTEDNLVYRLEVSNYINLKHYDSPKNAYRDLKFSIFNVKGKNTQNIRELSFNHQLETGEFEKINWFTSVVYNNGILTLELTPEMKKLLLQYRNHEDIKIFTRLRYYLPMQSLYSKRIYLMCRKFANSGIRYTDSSNWENFLELLNIPKSYSYSTIKTQILERAKEEIALYSDITIDYYIAEERARGGVKPIGIKFFIKKKEDIIDTPIFENAGEKIDEV